MAAERQSVCPRERHRPHALATVAAVATATVFVVGAILPAAATPRQRFRADVELVLLDCVVHDADGNLVVDLLPGDFDVFEDGERVDLIYFQPEGYVASEDFPWEPFPRDFVIFFDAVNTGPTQVDQVQASLHGFVDRLQRNDRAMLVMLTPQRRLLIAVPFPGDRQRLHQVIEELPADTEMEAVVQRREDELRYELYREGTEGTLSQEISKVQSALAVANEFAESDEERARYTIAALDSFGRSLAERRSRRAPFFVIFVSGGITLRPGASYLNVINQHIDRVNSEIQGRGAGNAPQPLFREDVKVDLTDEFQRAAAGLSEGNLVLYTVDARGVPASQGEGADSQYRSRLLPGLRMEPYRERQYSLKVLAEETGGLSFVNSSNFELAFTRVLHDSSFRYMLGYRPSKIREGGTYVPLAVEVNRPGLSVRYRKGYVAAPGR